MGIQIIALDIDEINISLWRFDKKKYVIFAFDTSNKLTIYFQEFVQEKIWNSDFWSQPK